MGLAVIKLLGGGSGSLLVLVFTLILTLGPTLALVLTPRASSGLLLFGRGGGPLFVDYC